MKNAFELKPLLVAAFIGATVFVAANHLSSEPISQSDPQAVGYGALIGISVQIGVRLLGVS